jgi:FdhE protein
MPTAPEIAPDPSKIGVIGQAPLALLPDPVALFTRRAKRLAFLAESSRLGPYLRFLSDLVSLQARLAARLPAIEPVPVERVERARAAGMPPIEAGALAACPILAATITALLDAATEIAQPEAARAALEDARGRGTEAQSRMVENLLAATVPVEEAAAHLYVAAGLQIHAARLAATLPAARLVPVGAGVCPCCGGRPATSIVTTLPKIEGVRYAACATCGTLWNEVRVKCLACGSTKGISYRGLGEGDTFIKAEVCDICQSWVKILYQTRDPALEAIADDVGGLGLDALMAETHWRRAGFDPFLIGY